MFIYEFSSLLSNNNHNLLDSMYNIIINTYFMELKIKTSQKLNSENSKKNNKIYNLA